MTLLLLLDEAQEEGPIVKGRTLTPLGVQMREALPPALQESTDYMGVIHACAKECERLAAHIETVRNQFNPGIADLLLGVWERITRQTVAPPGTPLAERQKAVTARLRKMLALGRGSAWEEQVTLLFGVGWSYEEHRAGVGTSPPEGVLRIKLPYGPSDPRYLNSITQLREITPAHLELQFSAEGGFILDKSLLDVEAMTV